MSTTKIETNVTVETENKRKRKPSKNQRLHRSRMANMTHTEFVHRVDWNRFRPKRAGVIVYTLYQGKILFGLGLDRRFKELTDFGGGIRYSKDQSAVIGALREFMEESLYSFGPFSPENVENAIVTYTGCMAIFLVYIQVDPIAASILFRERVSTIDSPEVSDIVWLTLDEFSYSIRNGKSYGGVEVYRKVRDVLRNSTLIQKPKEDF